MKTLDPMETRAEVHKEEEDESDAGENKGLSDNEAMLAQTKPITETTWQVSGITAQRTNDGVLEYEVVFNMAEVDGEGKEKVEWIAKSALNAPDALAAFEERQKAEKEEKDDEEKDEGVKEANSHVDNVDEQVARLVTLYEQTLSPELLRTVKEEVKVALLSAKDQPKGRYHGVGAAVELRDGSTFWPHGLLDHQPSEAPAGERKWNYIAPGLSVSHVSKPSVVIGAEKSSGHSKLVFVHEDEFHGGPPEEVSIAERKIHRLQFPEHKNRFLSNRTMAGVVLEPDLFERERAMWVHSHLGSQQVEENDGDEEHDEGSDSEGGGVVNKRRSKRLLKKKRARDDESGGMDARLLELVQQVVSTTQAPAPTKRKSTRKRQAQTSTPNTPKDSIKLQKVVVETPSPAAAAPHMVPDTPVPNFPCNGVPPQLLLQYGMALERARSAEMHAQELQRQRDIEHAEMQRRHDVEEFNRMFGGHK